MTSSLSFPPPFTVPSSPLMAPFPSFVIEVFKPSTVMADGSTRTPSTEISENDISVSVNLSLLYLASPTASCDIGESLYFPLPSSPSSSPRVGRSTFLVMNMPSVTIPSRESEVPKEIPSEPTTINTASAIMRSFIERLPVISFQIRPLIQPPANAVTVSHGMYAPVGISIAPRKSVSALESPPYRGPKSTAGKKVNIPPRLI